jgi:translation initiation factor 1 (eIF-1/SUI1)
MNKLELNFNDSFNAYELNNLNITNESIVVKTVKKHVITIIQNNNNKLLASWLKKNLACGGSITQDSIMLQGNQKSKVLELLKTLNKAN